jgi:hypothetical protein
VVGQLWIVVHWSQCGAGLSCCGLRVHSDLNTLCNTPDNTHETACCCTSVSFQGARVATELLDPRWRWGKRRSGCRPLLGGTLVCLVCRTLSKYFFASDSWPCVVSQLQSALAYVCRCLNERRDHLPPVVSASVVTYPFDISFRWMVALHNWCTFK